MRRDVPPQVAAEPLTLRVAVRNGVTGVSITNAAGLAGATSPDDVRPGAFYSLHRWRPSGNAWVFPGRSTVCATGIICATASIDGAPTTVDLCSASRFVAGSGWAFTGDQTGTPEECFWTLAQPGIAGSAAANLISTPRDLSRMTQSRLVVSFRRGWPSEVATGGSYLYFDLEVSTNSFSGCTFTNFGNCRIVRRIGPGQPWGVQYSPSRITRTVVADVSDFDGRPQVQMRVRVWRNDDSLCGNGTCDVGEAGAVGSCTTDCSAPATCGDGTCDEMGEVNGSCPMDCGGLSENPRLRVYDPVFVGWFQ
jgi:hypothetical protein